MRMFRSHGVVPLTTMPLATPDVLGLAEAEGVFERPWKPGTRLHLVAPANGSAPLLLAGGIPFRAGRLRTNPGERRTVAESVTHDDNAETLHYRVSADGFWQNHRAAPAVLVAEVLDGLRLGLGGSPSAATILDLYAGAGLFSLPLAAAVGPDGQVITVEGDARAVRDARRNVHGHPQVTVHLGAVSDVMPELGPADAVVLDPPRAGAGRLVIDAIAARRPQCIVYVACDPAALARDTAYLADHGFGLTRLRAFDLFPMTHHVEIVAVLTTR
jgi:tRNA/tmRNA/rRNA uracil-C5-methylase (TrmA/RlmC/RlmD family)